MAQAIVVFHQAGNRSLERDPMPVARLPGSRTAVLAAGAASKATTLAAEAAGPKSNSNDGGFVTVYATTANLWIASGAAPVAAKPAADATGTGFPLMAGTSSTFAVANGDKVAVIEWA